MIGQTISHYRIQGRLGAGGMGEVFEQATELDPTFAPAHAGLAAVYSVLPWYIPFPVDEAIRRAQAALDEALGLDPDSAEAHATLCELRKIEWRWADAEAACTRALELNPNYAPAQQWMAELLDDLGRPEEALPYAQRTHALDPLSPLANFSLALAWHDNGDLEAARAPFRRMEAGLGLVPIWDSVIDALLDPARLPATLARLREAEAMPGARWDWNTLAIVYGFLGRADDTMRMLERAYSVRDIALVYVAREPAFRLLHDDPRFLALLERIGLTL